VDLAWRTCVCSVFQNTNIPWEHAIAYIWDVKQYGALPLGSYITSEYSTMIRMETYAYNLQPVHFDIAIEICELHVCNKPKMNAPVGRYRNIL